MYPVSVMRTATTRGGMEKLLIKERCKMQDARAVEKGIEGVRI
jgi:carbonic anhydrase/acetyltransferase-like protein (isoleucine patch superfamily)